MINYFKYVYAGKEYTFYIKFTASRDIPYESDGDVKRTVEIGAVSEHRRWLVIDTVPENISDMMKKATTGSDGYGFDIDIQSEITIELLHEVFGDTHKFMLPRVSNIRQYASKLVEKKMPDNIPRFIKKYLADLARPKVFLRDLVLPLSILYAVLIIKYG